MATDNEGLIKELAQRMIGAKFWMYLIGILMIIYGVLAALTIVGIIFAWLPIWLGVLLCMAASSLNEASISGATEQMHRMLGRLKLFFVVQGVVMLVGIVAGIVSFLFFGSMIMGMIGGHLHNM